MQRGCALLCVAAAIAAAAIETAHAADASGYPNKPIRIIVPFPPGGSNDLLGRYFGERLNERLGQQIVIDNRGGANGIIGSQLAAAANPDGHTMLLVSVSAAMNAAVRKLPYDIEKSFDPIAMLGTNSNCVVVAAAGQYKTVKDVIAAAKAKPGALAYASTGVGGFNHFGGELFKKLAGVDIVHVPYKGGGPAMIDVMGGQIPMMFSSLTQTLPHARAGRLRVLAVGSDKRTPIVPDVPTFIEAGVPGYEIYGWWGMLVPAGVPKTIVAKLAALFTEIIRESGTSKYLAAEAADPRVMTPDELRAFIRTDVAKWIDVAKQAGIQAN